jgi:hypothetical protein
LRYYGVFIEDLVASYQQNNTPIVIHGRRLTPKQADTLIKINDSLQNFVLPRAQLEAGLDQFYGDPLRSAQYSNVSQHAFMTGYALPQRVVTEILQREYSFESSTGFWRANESGGLLSTLFAPILAHPEPITPVQRALMEAVDPMGLRLFDIRRNQAFADNDFLGGVSVISVRENRNTELYRNILRLLEDYHVGGGPKGQSDREIIADILFGERNQDLLENPVPPTFMTLDMGIVRGLLRLRLSAYIRSRQRREEQVRYILDALRSSNHFDSTLFPLFGEVRDYELSPFTQQSGRHNGTEGEQSIRVVTIRDIQIKEEQLEDLGFETYLSHPLHMDMMFMILRDSPPSLLGD